LVAGVGHIRLRQMVPPQPRFPLKAAFGAEGFSV